MRIIVCHLALKIINNNMNKSFTFHVFKFFSFFDLIYDINLLVYNFNACVVLEVQIFIVCMVEIKKKKV